MISFVDFKPTILSLAGIEPPSYLEGQGQAFLGPYKAAAPRTYIHAAADRFDERYDMIRAVRDNRFKYLRNYRPDQGYYLPISYREQMPLMQELLRMRDAGTLNETQMQWFRPSKPEEELFDTDADPHEINNMANDPAYAEKLVELRAEHDRWVEAIDDKGKMSETEYIDMIWPGRIQPVTEAPQVTRNGAEVTLASPTQGASIGYQIVSPGAEPGDTWQVYTDPVSLPENQELIAIADRIGYVPSGSVRVD
jgi:hypothetical protein